jgi:hypothetical protein
MPDVICRKCGEPWDSYGLQNGDVERTARRRILAGEGCPACGFGARCPSCAGSGKQKARFGTADCDHCYGLRTLTVWEVLNGPHSRRYPGIHYGSKPDVRELPGHLFDDAIELERRRPQKMGGNRVRETRIICPLCPDDAPVCRECGGDGKLHREADDGRFLGSITRAGGEIETEADEVLAEAGGELR